MNLLPKPFKALALAGMAASVAAAPMDALIEAMPSQRYGEGYLEFGADAMNSTLDVFKVRSQMGITDNTGNYQGFTLRAGHAFGNGGWLDGAYMRRNITVGADQYPVTSWRVGVQQKLYELPSNGAVLALRGSAWGNKSTTITKTNPSIAGITVNSISAIDPKDSQYQLDLISSWYLSQWSWSAFAGVGRGKVSIPRGQIEVIGTTYTYPDDFSTVPSSLQEHLGTLSYSLQMRQVGLNGSYVSGAWMYRLGYVVSQMQRPSVDSAISSLDNTPYKRNQTLVGEVAYKFTQNVHAYTRAQVMHRQFLSEIPFLYNSVTSPIFGVKYGVVSAGLGFSF